MNICNNIEDNANFKSKNSFTVQHDMSIEVKAASYEPGSPDERIRGISTLLSVEEINGFVFLLAYTDKETADSEILLQILNEHIHRLANSFGTDSNPQHRFEQFLGALNETLSEHVRDGRWSVPIEHLHAIVGVATPKQMYVSGTGELTALFLHKKPSDRYQIFNLFRGILTEQSLPTWEKTFAVVLDGDIHFGDVFCVCDKDLQRAITPDDLNQTLSTLPPVSAVARIKQFFPHRDSILLIVLRASGEDIETGRIQKNKSEMPAGLSLDELQNTQKTTDKLLADQRPNLSILLAQVVSWLKSKTMTKSRVLRDLNSKESTFTTLKRFGRILLRVSIFIAKRSIKHTMRVSKTLFDTQERNKLHKKIELAGKGTLASAQSFIIQTRRIPRSMKFLALGIIVAIFALIIGIVVLSKTQARTEAENEFNEKIAAVEEIMEQAAGAVIYKDESRAREQYLSAQTMINDLPKNTPDQTKIVQELLSDVQAALDEIRHLITIPNPPLLADLAGINGKVSGKSLISNGDTIYAFGSDGRVYKYDRIEKKFEVAIGDDTQAPVAISTTQEDGRVYILASDGSTFWVDLESKTVKSIEVGNARSSDLEAYADRLYFLRPTIDGVDGQVIRFDRNGTNFTNEKNWINSKTTQFGEAVSLAVDGTLYVLLKNGTIAKFEAGNEIEWDTETIEPKITAATKIWTDPNSKFIYVLEPETKRLVVFDKNSGAFIAQYRSDAFTDLKDFVVDEAGYSIYILAGSKLYSIAASHIK